MVCCILLWFAWEKVLTLLTLPMKTLKECGRASKTWGLLPKPFFTRCVRVVNGMHCRACSGPAAPSWQKVCDRSSLPLTLQSKTGWSKEGSEPWKSSAFGSSSETVEEAKRDILSLHLPMFITMRDHIGLLISVNDLQLYWFANMRVLTGLHSPYEWIVIENCHVAAVAGIPVPHWLYSLSPSSQWRCSKFYLFLNTSCVWWRQNTLRRDRALAVDHGAPTNEVTQK